MILSDTRHRCGHHGFLSSAGVVNKRLRRYWRASGQQATASWQQKRKITARRSMTTEKDCGFFSWYTQQCSTVSVTEEVMMQSRVKWLAYLVAHVIVYRRLVVLPDWSLRATMAREWGTRVENEAEAASYLVHRSCSEPSFRGSTPSRCFELQQADRLLAHGTVASDTCTPLLAYRIRGLME